MSMTEDFLKEMRHRAQEMNDTKRSKLIAEKLAEAAKWTINSTEYEKKLRDAWDFIVANPNATIGQVGTHVRKGHRGVGLDWDTIQRMRAEVLGEAPRPFGTRKDRHLFAKGVAEQNPKMKIDELIAAVSAKFNLGIGDSHARDILVTVRRRLVQNAGTPTETSKVSVSKPTAVGPDQIGHVYPIDKAKIWLQEFLRLAGPQPRKMVIECAVKAGFKDRTVERAAMALGVISKHSDWGRERIWVPAPGPTSAPQPAKEVPVPLHRWIREVGLLWIPIVAALLAGAIIQRGCHL